MDSQFHYLAAFWPVWLSFLIRIFVLGERRQLRQWLFLALNLVYLFGIMTIFLIEWPASLVATYLFDFLLLPAIGFLILVNCIVSGAILLLEVPDEDHSE